MKLPVLDNQPTQGYADADQLYTTAVEIFSSMTQRLISSGDQAGK